MAKPTKARVIAAEKSSRPFGWVLAVGGMLWEGISRLGEHIVLGWIAERIQGQELMVNLLYWSVDHPILFLGALAIIYLAYISIQAIFGHENEVTGNGGTNSTSGPRSPISTGNNSPAIGSVAAAKDAYIGGTHFHAQQPTRDAPEVRLILTQFSSRVAFAVENRSLVRDAENVTAELTNCNGFELNFELIPLLPRSSIPMELACKSFENQKGETNAGGGIVRFAIKWAESQGTPDGQPFAFDLRLLFSDPFAKYSRIVHISSSWPAFGLAQSTRLDHESIRTVPLEA
jgi:hypothetical protein